MYTQIVLLFCTNNKDFQKHNSLFSMLFKIKAIIIIIHQYSTVFWQQCILQCQLHFSMTFKALNIYFEIQGQLSRGTQRRIDLKSVENTFQTTQSTISTFRFYIQKCILSGTMKFVSVWSSQSNLSLFQITRASVLLSQ